MSKSKTADTAAEAPTTEKKGRKKLVFLLTAGLIVAGAGGGAAYGLMLKGVINGGGEHEVDDKPRLVRKGESDPYALPAPENAGEGAFEDVEGSGGGPYRTSYHSFTEEFTSNLRGSGHFVQTSLAASTHYDGRVLMWLKKHELAVRSAVLITLADTSEEDAYSVAGKQRLQKRLTAAINEVLTAREGFGGVGNVYFKTYIVQ